MFKIIFEVPALKYVCCAVAEYQDPDDPLNQQRACRELEMLLLTHFGQPKRTKDLNSEYSSDVKEEITKLIHDITTFLAGLGLFDPRPVAVPITDIKILSRDGDLMVIFDQT